MMQPAKSVTAYNGLFAKKDLLFTGTVSIAYLLLSKILIGFHPEQLVLVFIYNALYYASFITRKFIMGFSVFLVFWIIFDYMKAFPNYAFSKVHVQSLYIAEKQLFGIHSKGAWFTPNEYFLHNPNTWLDVVSGLFYLCWMPVPLFFAGYLFFTNRRQFMYFSLTFLLVNFIGWIGYYTYPAAPPWYIQQYGFSFNPHTPGNVAGLHRFDDFFGVSLFHALYAKSSNVFAAMPSLHSSYAMVVFYYAYKNRLPVMRIFTFSVMVGTWFAAVYTSHHYILDVVAGIVCAALGIFIFNKWLIPSKRFDSLFVRRFVEE